MYCTNCGSQISDQAVFCHHCGAKQTEDPSIPTITQPTPVVPPVNSAPPVAPPASFTPPMSYYCPVNYGQMPVTPIPDTGKSSVSAVRIIFGILLILGGLIPYLLLTNNVNFMAGMMQSAYAYGSLFTSAYSALVGCFGIFEKLLVFPAHMFSLISGIILLQSQRRHKGLLVTSGIFHLLSALFYAFVPVISKGILTSYMSYSYGDFPIVSMIWNNTIWHLALALVIAVLSFTVLFFKLPNARLKKERCGPCLFIMIPFLGLMVLVSSLETGILAGFMGNAKLAAYSSVNAALANRFGSYLFWIFLALLVLSVALRKIRFHWFALITGGVLLIASAIFSAQPPFAQMQLPDSYISYGMDFYPLLYWGSALTLLATALWIIAATRNCVPLWLQWLLCVALVPLRIIVSVIGFAAYGFTAVNIGQFVCAIVILIASVTAGLVHTGKHRS